MDSTHSSFGVGYFHLANFLNSSNSPMEGASPLPACDLQEIEKLVEAERKHQKEYFLERFNDLAKRIQQPNSVTPSEFNELNSMLSQSPFLREAKEVENIKSLAFKMKLVEALEKALYNEKDVELSFFT